MTRLSGDALGIYARTMPRVIVESPYSGDHDANVAYLRACLHDCLMRGEAPFASHGLYTQPGVLRDRSPAERELGIGAGFAWRYAASKTVVYLDLDITDGMRAGIEHAAKLGHEIEFRWLPPSARLLACVERWP